MSPENITHLVLGVMIAVAGVLTGLVVNQTHHTTKPVKPSITITNVDGVVDTTYTYSFYNHE